MFFHGLMAHSSLVLNDVPLSRCITPSLSISLLKDNLGFWVLTIVCKGTVHTCVQVPLWHEVFTVWGMIAGSHGKNIAGSHGKNTFSFVSCLWETAEDEKLCLVELNQHGSANPHLIGPLLTEVLGNPGEENLSIWALDKLLSLRIFCWIMIIVLSYEFGGFASKVGI